MYNILEELSQPSVRFGKASFLGGSQLTIHCVPFRKWLFTGTVPANRKYVTGTV
jgi:hypothetical protein